MPPTIPGIKPGAQGPTEIPDSQMPADNEISPTDENDMSKIGDQTDDNPEQQSLVEQAIGMVDAAMQDLQNSPDPKIAIKSLCAELESLVGDEGY